MPSSLLRYRALYTRHVRQKHKVYHDAILEVDTGSGVLTMTDEAGRRLGGAAVRPDAPGGACPSWPPPGDAEGLTWFDGFLVSLDGLEGDGGGCGAALPVPVPVPRPALAARPPQPPPQKPSFVPRPRTDEEIMGVLLGKVPALPLPPVPAKRVRREGGGGAEPAPPPHPAPAAAPPPPPPPPPFASAGARWAAPRSGGAAGGTWGLVTTSAAAMPTAAAPQRGPSPSRPGRCDLAFPPSAVAALPPRRHAAIADTFPGPGPYLAALREAVVEDLNLRVAAVAARFHAARARVASGAGATAPAAPPPIAAVARACKAAGLYFYPDSTLQVCGSEEGEKRGAWKGGRGGGRGGRPAAAASPDHQGGTPRRTGRSLFLTLSGAPLPPSSACHKDDLWVLSTDPGLVVETRPGTDRLAAPWVALARAAWHGPNKEGRLEVAWCSATPPPTLRCVQAVAALHVGEAASELAALASFDGPGAADGDGLICVLAAAGGGGGREAVPAPPGPAVALATAAAASARLNPDQARVLTTVASWADARDAAAAAGAPPPPPRVCVVHGPFGSGKSATLTALVRFLAGLSVDGGLGARVLIAAHTNAAVDRIMVKMVEAPSPGEGSGGAEEGATAATAAPDLIRVGPLRRMDRALLPWSLHAPGATGADAAVELNSLLQAATCPSEAAALREELARVKAGAVTRRRKRLGSAAVVGATCASAAGLGGGGDGEPAAGAPARPAFAPFQVAVLDEASQVTEPLAVMALLATRCTLGIVVAGDPCQLPPVVPGGPAAVTPRPDGASGGHQAAAGAAAPPPPHLHGLGRSLLARLLAGGKQPPLLLGIQYRCHPAISGLANRLFYGGRLADGVSGADRPALLPGLPPLTCLDVAGGITQYDAYRSAFNAVEARAVARAVAALITTHGLDPARIGVIVPFRAHARAVVAALAAADAAAGAGVEVVGDADEGGAPPPPPPPLPPRAASVFVATVDAAQGLEWDIVFLSVGVRGGGGGFAGDAHRLCVAFTRARHHLILAGAVRDLAGMPAFRDVVAEARKVEGGVMRAR
jgi:hypothetical protein